jgi:hypothetical protein
MSSPSEAKRARRRARQNGRTRDQEYARLAHQGRLRERGAAKVFAMAAYAAGKTKQWTT